MNIDRLDSEEMRELARELADTELKIEVGRETGGEFVECPEVGVCLFFDGEKYHVLRGSDLLESTSYFDDAAGLFAAWAWELH